MSKKNRHAKIGKCIRQILYGDFSPVECRAMIIAYNILAEKKFDIEQSSPDTNKYEWEDLVCLSFATIPNSPARRFVSILPEKIWHYETDYKYVWVEMFSWTIMLYCEPDPDLEYIRGA